MIHCVVSHKLSLARFIMVAVFGICNSTGLAKSSFLGVDEMLSTLESHYGNISTLQVTFSEELIDITSPEGKSLPNDKGIIEYYQKSIIKDMRTGRYHAKSTREREGIENAEVDRVLESAYDGEITKQYYGRMSYSAFIKPGMTNDSMPHAEKTFLHYMLLENIGKGSLGEEYPDGLSFCSYLFHKRKDIEIQVSGDLETINGQECHVLKIPGPKGSGAYSELWLAHDKNMLPMKYKEVVNGAVMASIEVFSLKSQVTDLGVVWFPAEVERTVLLNHWQGEKTSFILTRLCKVESFYPNIPVRDEDFTFNFPEGTYVKDMVQNINYTIGGGKDFNENINKTIEKLEDSAVGSDVDNEIITDLVEETPSTPPSSEKPFSSKRNITSILCLISGGIFILGAIFWHYCAKRKIMTSPKQP